MINLYFLTHGILDPVPDLCQIFEAAKKREGEIAPCFLGLYHTNLDSAKELRKAGHKGRSASPTSPDRWSPGREKKARKRNKPPPRRDSTPVRRRGSSPNGPRNPRKRNRPPPKYTCPPHTITNTPIKNENPFGFIILHSASFRIHGMMIH